MFESFSVGAAVAVADLCDLTEWHGNAVNGSAAASGHVGVAKECVAQGLSPDVTLRDLACVLRGDPLSGLCLHLAGIRRGGDTELIAERTKRFDALA
ncbi:hypothetical protein ATCCBAA256_32980 [Mycobacterium montefiorense]|nr:hypothetical protein ATCCBAA256_32980 [Mycobacterium montefiorense]